jgi:multicomponent Na+:H+ antiporter subunit F
MDIALAYALINFVSTIAVLRFFAYRSFGDPCRREGGSAP